MCDNNGINAENTMHPNGTTQTTENPSRGEIEPRLPDGWQPMLSDLKWVEEQYNAGAWDEFNGEYVAVVERRLIGHGRTLDELRERAARESGHPVNRIVVTLIDRELN